LNKAHPAKARTKQQQNSKKLQRTGNKTQANSSLRTGHEHHKTNSKRHTPPHQQKTHTSTRRQHMLQTTTANITSTQTLPPETEKVSNYQP
jgi:hypothetical protein